MAFWGWHGWPRRLARRLCEHIPTQAVEEIFGPPAATAAIRVEDSSPQDRDGREARKLMFPHLKNKVA